MEQTGSEKPKVSVLVVTYNQQETIARTLDSILNQQTNFQFEIEIADDCSTDRTPDICREYALQFPTRVRYVRNHENLGVRENYFRALRRCRAQYIADCAGDDYWVDELKLQKQADILDKHPDVGMVHTAWCYVDEISGNITQANTNKEEFCHLLKPFSEPGELIEAIYTKTMLIHWCTALYRKSIFEAAEMTDPYPFVSDEIRLEDFQLSVIYARDARVAYIPDITMYYTIGHDSMTHTRNLLKEFDFVLSLTKLKEHFSHQLKLPQSILKSIYRQKARFLYSAAFIHMDSKRMHQVDGFYRMHRLHRPLRCKIMHILLHMPGLGHAFAQLKKAHYYWKLKKWI